MLRNAVEKIGLFERLGTVEVGLHSNHLGELDLIEMIFT